VNGIIKARLFTEGADVRAGQVLYQIDPAPYRAALDQAKGQLANAQANLVTARLKSERYNDLVKINAVSRQDADDAKAAYGQAAANVQQYAASVQSARINLGYTSVTAPISGKIGRALFTPGALVQAEQTNALAQIQRLDPIYVDVTRSADELLRLKQEIARGRLSGADTVQVKLKLSDGSDYGQTGTPKLSEPQVDPTTGSVTLRAIFQNPGKLLLPGMYVRAEIVEAIDRSGVLAPQQGITRDPKGQATAMVVNAQGKAEQRNVTTDRAVGDKWLVTSGLKPGDKLITEGLINVHAPGQPVRAVPAGSKPAGNAAGGGAGAGQGGGGGAPGTAPASGQHGR
jgi:membrane fusion protein, multidrug efflux system